MTQPATTAPPIQRHDTVRAVTGEHRGECGRVIAGPFRGRITFSCEGGRTFDVAAGEVEVVGDKVEVKS